MSAAHGRPAAAPTPLTDAEILEVSDGCWTCGQHAPVVVVHGLPLCAHCDSQDAPAPDDTCETLVSFPAVRGALRCA